MIQFEHLILADNDPITFSIGWQGDSQLGWTLLDQPLTIQFRRGNRFNSDVVANATYTIANSNEFGTNGLLNITLVPVTEIPEYYLYYDILQDDGQRFGYGSIEVIRGVSND
jgi:hypothetical protein